MQVRVQMQILAPGVKHCEEADGGAQESRVSGGFEQGLRSSAEQDGVNLVRVLERQTADLLRQSKHHVKIGHRQKFCLPLLEPAGTGGGLALGTVPVAARVIQDDAMSAPITLLKVAAQSRGPAVANVSQRFPLM